MKIETEIEVQIGRGMSGSRTCWFFTIQDRRSRRSIVRFTLSDREMGTALGCCPVEVPAEVFQQEQLGKYMETKIVKVPIPESVSFSHPFNVEGMKTAADAYVADHLPGEHWIPRYPTGWNDHLVDRGEDGGHVYTVTLQRFTDEKPEDT